MQFQGHKTSKLLHVNIQFTMIDCQSSVVYTLKTLTNNHTRNEASIGIPTVQPHDLLKTLLKLVIHRVIETSRVSTINCMLTNNRSIDELKARNTPNAPYLILHNIRMNEIRFHHFKQK